MFGMDRPHQFSLAHLFTDTVGIALALAVLRLSLIPGDDAYFLPAIGLMLGLVIGLPARRAGAGAFVGCLALTGLMYVLAWIQQAR